MFYKRNIGKNKINLAKLYLVFVLLFPVITCAQTTKLLPDEQNTIDVFKQASPYVVNVHNLRTVINPYFDVYNIRTGIGSGIIWGNKGYIVTNYHVIRNANKIAVTLRKGETVLAKVVGVAPSQDIAVLKISSKKTLQDLAKLEPLPIADSSKLLVGQKTIAIGNPYGLGHTLTTGIISALNRNIRSVTGFILRNMIQTDASINPGNSGGPLLDSQGHLIGMNTLLYSKTGTSIGIGFAVPSNAISRIVAQILRYGKVIQPTIGIHVLNEKISRQLGVKGILIAKVAPNSPAAKAGLRGTFRDRAGRINLGDIIVAVNGKQIHNYNDFYDVLSELSVGDKIELTIMRQGQLKKVTLDAVELP